MWTSSYWAYLVSKGVCAVVTLLVLPGVELCLFATSGVPTQIVSLS